VDASRCGAGGWLTGIVPDAPGRSATDAYFAAHPGERLAVGFDVDLGELVAGHHVVARGLEFGRAGTVLHYEFVPALLAGRVAEL